MPGGNKRSYIFTPAARRYRLNKGLTNTANKTYNEPPHKCKMDPFHV